MPRCILAIDQGTTSTRANVYDVDGNCIGSAGKELTQHFPQPGWVEHDADEIWQAVAQLIPEALRKSGVAATDIAGIGITNQRETVVLWERTTSRPVAHAIVWQDRRTADFCRARHADETWLAERTGLVLDPYFSATKLRWLLDNVPDARQMAGAGRLAAGTIDSWLIWKLTGSKAHVTDRSNASRTLLLNLQTAAWDEELCRYFEIPASLLPEVRPSVSDFGTTAGLDFLPGGLRIGGVAGDQQAALFGQGGFERGLAKCTYGTGAFFLQHLGDQATHSKRRLLTSLAATTDERLQYVLEGSVFVAGAAVQWLRDGLQALSASAEVEDLAAASDPEQPILFVPAFVGLGAPYWIPEARGALFGLTRNTSRKEFGRAVLEGVAHQVVDLIEAAGHDTGQPLQALRVDGGMAANAWFLQTQADLLGMPVVTAACSEATAQGAAYLAGLQAGLWSLDKLKKHTRDGRRFEPELSAADRRRKRASWTRAVAAVSEFYRPN
ncbi:MAG: glycerol kinase GlpK [Planctomycetes bacterium]|nr:glycerol kinase GlpK [Planctomycetota bacterium]